MQTGKHGYINTTFTTTMGYCVIILISEVYTIQEETMWDINISSAGELIVWKTTLIGIAYNHHNKMISFDRVQDSLWNKSSVWLDKIEFRTRLNRF